MSVNEVRGAVEVPEVDEVRVDCRGDAVDSDVDPDFCPGCGHFGGCFPREANCGDRRCCH